MTKVGIITDSVACLPTEKIKEYGIGIVPYMLNINGKSYLDQIEITPDEFWKMFKDIKQLTTGAPAQGIFINAYREMSQKTNEIVCTFVSKALSAMQESAAQAREIFREENPRVKIEIVDSRTAAGAEGFVALAMARAAASGKNLPEVVQTGLNTAPRSKFLFGVETLKYLIRGGRAPKIAYVGEIIGIKPIVGIVDSTGLVASIGRARGMHACMHKLMELVSKYANGGKQLHVNIHYSNDIEKGHELLKLITAKYECCEAFFTPFTPVMCGHTGPSISVCFYSE